MPIKAILKTNNKINNKTNNRTNNIINNKTNNKTNNIINNKTNNINNNKINEDSYLDKINEFCTIYSTNNNFIISNPKIEFRYFCYKYIDNIQNIKNKQFLRWFFISKILCLCGCLYNCFINKAVSLISIRGYVLKE